MILNPYLPKNALLATGLLTAMSSNSLAAVAGNPLSMSLFPVKQVARYSVTRPSPTLGQQHLLALSIPLRVPNEIATVGGALEWMIKDSGYRLADPDHLTPDVKDMLGLPLPEAHRQFQALPLKDVIALLAGPAFVLVHDPVHRLFSFERCRDSTQRQVVTKTKQHENVEKGDR